MRKRKVINDFRKISIPRLSLKAAQVHHEMNGNVNFPNAPVLMTDLDANIKDLIKKAAKAAGGDRHKRKQMHVSAAKLREKLVKLLVYVNTEADGDEVKLASSGFKLSKAHVYKGKPLFSVYITDIPGEVELYFHKTRKTASVIWMICQKNSEPVGREWELLNSTTAGKYLVRGLTSGQKYYFKAAPVITNSTILNWTEPIYKFIN